MAPSSHPRHAQPGTAIQMPLGTPLNKRPHTKRCMRSSPHHSFRQAHRGRPSDDDNVLHGFFPSGSSQSSRTRKPTRSVKITSIYTAKRYLLQPYPVCNFVPRGESFASSARYSQDKPPRSSHPEWQDLRQEGLEGIKKQRCLDHEQAWKDSTPTVVARRVTMRQSVPSQGRTETLQKTIPREAILERVPCIWYPTTFRENLCCLYSTQEVGSMPYTLPSLKNWASGSDQALLEMFFDVGAQKTDGTTLDTYGMVVAAFSVTERQIDFTLNGVCI